ncbi:hypothetical protein [Mesorhizobium sp.]|uniref:hypothetical protein n=1 Tax=Mesorhizobium sp. TaxID=1871066 RepID=UPI0032AEC5B7
MSDVGSIERQQPVRGAPRLERARDLQQLKLQSKPIAFASSRLEIGRLDHRRAADIASDPLGRRPDVVQLDDHAIAPS